MTLIKNLDFEVKKVYNSKIGLELVIPLVLVFGTVLFLTISEKPDWIRITILLLAILFITHIFLTTNYTIEGDNLTIRSGFLINKSIDIKTIKKISETNNPISSPAISIDKLK